MSTDVYVQLVRKSDYCPGLDWWFGGITLKRALERAGYEFERIDDGLYALGFKDYQTFKNMMLEHADDIAIDNELYNYLQNEGEYAIWLLMAES